MASSAGNPLGAAGSREVVFCHACQHEWYRDERESLECPRCQSSFTEIVESSNDPRVMDLPTFPGLGRGPNPYLRRPADYDSDPDEGDIEEHLRNGPGSAFGRPTPPPRFGAQNDGGRPNEGDAILRRFADMLMNDLGGGRTARGGPAAGGGLFPPEENAPRPATRIQHTTFRSGPFGARTSVTVTSGTFGGGPEGSPIGTLFDQIFGNPFGIAGPEDAARRERGPADPGFPFAGGLQDLLNSLYNPAAAVHGDAVFTQEALDRIVTQLMEASPQTNAAPPASQTAIESLEKKRVDDEMLGPEGKAECTICIDELKKGDEVSVLPCKHWYHGECVVLWLKEHNTCPICRMPIENRQGGGGNNNNSNNNNRNDNNPSQSPQDPQSASASTSTSAAPAPGSGSGPASAYTTATSTAYPLGPFSFASSLTARPRPERERERDRPLRSARQNLERLNSIRNLAAGVGGEQQQQRRNSHSPPGAAWAAADVESALRASRVRSSSGERREREEREREREGESDAFTDRVWGGYGGGGGASGSASGRRESQSQQSQSQQQQQQQGSGGNGPFGWLRDHFGRRG